MKIFRYLLPAAVVLCAASAPASAFPVQSTPVGSSAIEVQHRDHRDMRRDHRRDMRRDHRPNRHMHRHSGPRYTPGARYRSPPPGWRRYGARPGDWRTRGCVMAGPIWFCP